MAHDRDRAHDDHNSAAGTVRAFQRAANQDKVHAVIATSTSAVALALEPRAGRLHLPTITPGAAREDISKRIHADYEHLKYDFHGYLASAYLAQAVCDAAKDLLTSSRLHMTTAVIMSEDAAWTGPLDAGYEACLPGIGQQVLEGHQRRDGGGRVPADRRRYRGQHAQDSAVRHRVPQAVRRHPGLFRLRRL